MRKGDRISIYSARRRAPVKATVRMVFMQLDGSAHIDTDAGRFIVPTGIRVAMDNPAGATR